MKVPQALLLSFVAVYCSALSQTTPIVVDNQNAKFEGDWTVGKSATDKHGSDYSSSFGIRDIPTAIATYRPNISAPGKYHVEIFYPRGDNRSTNAPWLISCKVGSTTANVNQTQQGGKWVRIGSDLEFAAGTTGFVQLKNNTPDAGESAAGAIVVVADAVRFVPTGGSSAVTSSPSPQVKTVSPPKPDPKGPRYSVRVSLDGAGRIIRNPNQTNYLNNSSITLTAIPSDGFIFNGWSGDVSTFKNPLTFQVSDNTYLTAHFISAAIGVIMDNLDPEADFEGSWTTSEKPWPGTRGENYQFAGCVAGKPTLFATFRPVLPKAGLYDIYIWYAHGGNRSTNAPFEIVFKGGQMTVPVNQQSNGGQWVLLAAGKEFEKGSGGYVRVNNNAGPIPSVVIVDSVAFVYVGQP